MKRIILFGTLMLTLFTSGIVNAQQAKAPAKKPAPKPKPKTDSVMAKPEVAAETPKEAEGIHWLTMTEIQIKMREKPKKVFVDFYTGWCGWCKRMEATTFQNAALIKYINNNFYAMRFDAESQYSFNFNGKEYHFDPQYKANTFAVEMLKGQMGYPTSLFMMENFTNPTPIPGYHPVKEMEMILRFFGDNVCKHQDMGSYQKTFVSAWDNGEPATPMAPPPGH
jgi:thioredoxin-related protein